MDSYEKARRKVRFNLPVPERVLKLRDTVKVKEHETLTYINGTLSAVKRPDVVTKIVRQVPVSIKIIPQLPPVSCLKPKAPDVIKYKSEVNFRNRLPVTTSSSTSAYSVVGCITPLTKDEYQEKLKELKARHVVILSAPPPKVYVPKMEDSLAVCDKYSRIKLLEDILKRKRKFFKRGVRYEGPKPILIKDSNLPSTKSVTTVSKNLFSPERNSNIVADLVQRWHRLRYREETTLNTDADKIITRKDPLETVSFRNRLKAGVKSFGCLKMSLDQEPPVTTLLRAARDADEQLLKIVLKKILVDSISKEALNSCDKSGRTAISYICSTNLTNFLDILLRIPGIDVNKPDNDGNTPLHFAAQAGQADALNMMLTRCRDLQVDAKNYLGFTPLMKAALQGRTRCAKLLLFAGASPTATDAGRRLTAEEWARFCGRETCAEMLQKCGKVRMLEKANSMRTPATGSSKLNLTRSKTNPNTTQIHESFQSKFKKYIPGFNFSSKDKKSKVRDVSILLNTAFSAGHTPVVPKLQVTPANNQQLLKKYETQINRDWR